MVLSCCSKSSLISSTYQFPKKPSSFSSLSYTNSLIFSRKVSNFSLVAERRKDGKPASPARRRTGVCRCLFGLGVPELAVIAAVATLLFGPKKLPEIGRSIGKTVKSFQQLFLKYYNDSLVRDNASKSIVEFKGVAKVLGGLQANYTTSAPKVMYYSARGPDPQDNSLANADIMKPNLIAPGNLIWGAWSSIGTDSAEFEGYNDYLSFLCGINNSAPVVLNYTSTTCSQSTLTGSDLNLPSITLSVLNQSRTITRTVTNIASDDETYKVGFSPPYGTSITITPSQFSIESGKVQILSFTFTATLNNSSPSYGRLGLYGSRGHIVNVPITVVSKIVYNSTVG